MSIIDHGTWVQYTPSEPPKNAPPNAMYCKRESDNVDWYDYVHSGKHFQQTSVKLTVRRRANDGPVIVSAPAIDPERLFPAEHRLVEIEGDFQGVSINALIDRFASKIINLETGEITDPPPPKEPPITDAMAAIMARLDKLEAK